MAHQSPVALVGLNNGRRLEIILVEAVGNLLDFCEVLVELADVDVTTLDTVAIGVERIRLSRLVIGKCTKVLRPVSERGSGVVKNVGSSDLVGSGKSLQEQTVLAIVGMPPHLIVLANGDHPGHEPGGRGLSYVVFARLLAVQDLGALDDAVGGDVRVILDGL